MHVADRIGTLDTVFPSHVLIPYWNTAIQLGYFVGAAVGGVALAVGGYSAVGLAFAGLFACATVPHLWPRARDRVEIAEVQSEG